jgi:hypothetical protein
VPSGLDANEALFRETPMPGLPAKRVPLRDIACANALAAFDPERFWPAHPQEDGCSDGQTSLYVGAVGMMWALDYLARMGATKVYTDLRPVLRPVLPHLLERLRKGFAGIASPELDALLVDGGSFTWATGPLAKGSNLCHGTGGNGYAFLKLHRRLKDSLWLDRARAFAMTAVAQCREARAKLGRGRYSLWTSDIGLACYLWDCLTANPQFPTVDEL